MFPVVSFVDVQVSSSVDKIEVYRLDGQGCKKFVSQPRPKFNFGHPFSVVCGLFNVAFSSLDYLGSSNRVVNE
jgi:hypothetical protein